MYSTSEATAHVTSHVPHARLCTGLLSCQPGTALFLGKVTIRPGQQCTDGTEQGTVHVGHRGVQGAWVPGYMGTGTGTWVWVLALVLYWYWP